MQLKLPAYKVPKKSMRHVRRYWLTIAFFLGFAVDTVTLNRVDQLFDNFVLFFYVIFAMTSLLLLYAGVADKLPERWAPHSKKYAPLAVQFAFGGLLSGMLIFYGRSGDFSQSWPFILIILAVIYGNETIRERSSRLIFNLSIFFVGLFSWVVLIIPVFTGYMGPWIFVGSGLLALMIMYGFIRLLNLIIPRYLELKRGIIIFAIGTIFAVFNFLYFANIIPPIPLSLKDVGIYHSIVRFDDGTYQLKYEEGSWWQPFKNSDDTFHQRGSDNVYCFASVFAPTRLSTDIYNKWERKDEETGKWVEFARPLYSIDGGRGGGFRGYTFINNFKDGKWRCTVETERGQVLGREVFTIDSTEPALPLKTRLE